jgi:hypothetical protein
MLELAGWRDGLSRATHDSPAVLSDGKPRVALLGLLLVFGAAQRACSYARRIGSLAVAGSVMPIRPSLPRTSEEEGPRLRDLGGHACLVSSARFRGWQVVHRSAPGTAGVFRRLLRSASPTLVQAVR